MGNNIIRINPISKISDVLNDNIDVEVELDDGSVYTITFFTLMNIHYLMNKHKHITDENNKGTFFWASDMCIVEILELSVIENAARAMLDDGILEKAFLKVR